MKIRTPYSPLALFTCQRDDAVGRIRGVACSCGVNRDLRKGVARYASVNPVTLMVWTTPAPASARSELCQDGCR
jgi:hypothetical protein